MEKTSSNTLSPSTYSLSGSVVFLLYNVSLKWVIGLKKFYTSSRCFFHSEFFYRGSSKIISNSELSKRKSSLKEEIEDVKLSKQEMEMVMGRLRITCEADDEMQIGLNEFSKMFEEKEPSVEEVKKAFEVFDENRDGFVDVAELQRVLCVLGITQGSKLEECEKMIRVYDKNRDGLIDFNEFVKVMESSFF